MEHFKQQLEQSPEGALYAPLMPAELLYNALKYSDNDGYYGDQYDGETILIAGDSGSGKTTYLKDLIQKISGFRGYFSLYVDLNQESHTPGATTLFDLIIFILNRLSNQLAWEQIEPDQRALRRFYLWYQQIAMEINTYNDIEIKLPVALKGRIDLDQLVTLFQKLKLFLLGTSRLKERLRGHFHLYRATLLKEVEALLKGYEVAIEQCEQGRALLIVLDHLNHLPFTTQQQLIPLLERLNVTMIIPVHGVISAQLPSDRFLHCWFSSGINTPGIREKLLQIVRKRLSEEELSDQLLGQLIAGSGGLVGQLFKLLSLTLKYSATQSLTPDGFQQGVNWLIQNVITLKSEELTLLQNLDPEGDFPISSELFPLLERGIILQPEPMRGMVNPLYRNCFR